MVNSWRGYVGRFHAERAGITEHVLRRCRPDPYRWLLEELGELGESGVVLDVACGSAPLAGPGTPVRRWFGLDASPDELRLAARRAAGRVVLGDAAALPFGTGRADAVVVTMALQVLQPLDAVVREMARVLRPGGRLLVLVPAPGPMSVSDAVRYAALLLALRRWRHGRPHHDRDLVPALRAGGFAIRGDESRRVRYPIDGPADAELFVDSMYLPDLPGDRLARARQVFTRYPGRSVGLPLRRIVATRVT